MPYTPEDLELIAWQARHDFDSNQTPLLDLKHLLLQEQPGFQDPEGYIAQVAQNFPRNSSGIASIYLRHLLGEGQVIEGGYIPADRKHVFLTLGELVIDITADQYDGPPVYVGPLQPPYKLLAKS